MGAGRHRPATRHLAATDDLPALLAGAHHRYSERSRCRHSTDTFRGHRSGAGPAPTHATGTDYSFVIQKLLLLFSGSLPPNGSLPSGWPARRAAPIRRRPGIEFPRQPRGTPLRSPCHSALVSKGRIYTGYLRWPTAPVPPFVLPTIPANRALPKLTCAAWKK